MRNPLRPFQNQKLLFGCVEAGDLVQQKPSSGVTCSLRDPIPEHFKELLLGLKI